MRNYVVQVMAFTNCYMGVYFASYQESCVQAAAVRFRLLPELAFTTTFAQDLSWHQCML